MTISESVPAAAGVALPLLDLRRQARQAGALYLLVALTAPVGLMYVPGRLVDKASAAATAANLAEHAGLLRLGMGSEVFHQAVEVFLVPALYRLFKPVAVGLARQMAVLGLIPIPMVFLCVASEWMALLVVQGDVLTGAFDKPQRDALAWLLMRLHGQGLAMAEFFWGLWLVPLGLLVARCGSMPRAVGWLAVAAGVGYTGSAATRLLAPGLAEPLGLGFLALEMGELVLILWLAIFGARLTPPRR